MKNRVARSACSQILDLSSGSQRKTVINRVRNASDYLRRIVFAREMTGDLRELSALSCPVVANDVCEVRAAPRLQRSLYSLQQTIEKGVLWCLRCIGFSYAVHISLFPVARPVISRSWASSALCFGRRSISIIYYRSNPGMQPLTTSLVGEKFYPIPRRIVHWYKANLGDFLMSAFRIRSCSGLAAPVLRVSRQRLFLKSQDEPPQKTIRSAGWVSNLDLRRRYCVVVAPGGVIAPVVAAVSGGASPNLRRVPESD